MISFITPLLLKSTCQMSTTEATGTIIGLRKKVRNWLLRGILASSSMASPSARTTASGTARAEKVAVFLAASRKAEFLKRAMKLSRNTNSGFIELRMTE